MNAPFRTPRVRSLRARTRRTGLALAAGIVALLGAVAAVAQGPASGRVRHVVMISLDGFAADYLDDPRLPLPNIRRLAAEGTRADRMTVITPSVTWPDHTTLVTGVTPAKHGVLANGRLELTTGNPPMVINGRRSKMELTQFPTLFDVAKGAGMKTAEVNWPVTRSAPTLDFSFPDSPDTLRYTTPALVQELQAQNLLPQPTDSAFRNLGPVMRDHVWTQAAVWILKKHRPNLLLLHLLNTDGTQHQFGPQTAPAYTALALADRSVGDVVNALRDANMLGETAVFVVADHGFMTVQRQINPNARLRKEGLIRMAEGGSGLEYDAQSVAEGGVALVYVPRGKFRPELVARTRAALNGMEGVDQILTPDEYRTLGLPLPSRNPQAPDFLLTAKDGYAFTNASDGADVVALERPVGVHGYAHTNRKMDALFVASGPGIKKGGRLERIRNVDVAPSIARLLGLELRDVDGQAPDGLFGQ